MRRDSTDTRGEESVSAVLPVIDAEVVRHDDEPDECTLYPATVASRDERMSAWMTARGGGFVDLHDVR